MALELNSSNSSQFFSQTPQLQNSMELPTPWSCSANGGGVLEHLFCSSDSTQSWLHLELRLQLELAPPGVLEWSSSIQSWSHAKQGLSRLLQLEQKISHLVSRLPQLFQFQYYFSKSQMYLIKKITTYCGSDISEPDILLLSMLKVAYSNLSITNTVVCCD